MQYLYKWVQDTNKRSQILKHCLWISLLFLFPLAYCGLYKVIRDQIRDEFTIKDKATSDFSMPDFIKTDILYLDTVVVSSSGPAALLYPDSLGEYKLRSNFTFNNFPVYEHSERDDRFIINNGIQYS